MAKKTEATNQASVIDTNAQAEETQAITKISPSDYDKILAGHYRTAELLVAKYNSLDGEDAPKSKLDECQEEIDKAISSYNELSFAKFLCEVRNSSTPMKTAVEMFSYPVIKDKEKSVGDKDAKVIIKVISESRKTIDLKAVDEKVKGGIANNTSWYRLVEKFNMLMTIRTAAEINTKTKKDGSEESVSNTYKRISSALINAFDIPTESKNIALTPDVITNKTSVKALQIVIDAMFGEGVYKVTTHDVRYLDRCYGTDKGTKENTGIKCKTTKEFTATLLKIAHKLVTNGVYVIETKMIKVSK